MSENRTLRACQRCRSADVRKATVYWQCLACGHEWIEQAASVDDQLDDLQATYDRKVAHRARLVRYYDDCPDGDPRKAEVLQRLTLVGKQIIQVERQIDRLSDGPLS